VELVHAILVRADTLQTCTRLLAFVFTTTIGVTGPPVSACNQMQREYVNNADEG